MKKNLIKFATVFILVSGLGLLFSSINVEAATAYPNGVYCNKTKCWVDWNKAQSDIGKIIVNGWVQSGPWS